MNGNKADLVEAVLHGVPIRVISNENYVTSVQNAAVLDGNVFAQALFHISKAGYDRFQVFFLHFNLDANFEQGIASDTVPSHCTILLTGLIAGWILIC